MLIELTEHEAKQLIDVCQYAKHSFNHMATFILGGTRNPSPEYAHLDARANVCATMIARLRRGIADDSS